jgi:molybdate-binding protein/DNA-binding transcriptional ArsR family regulator
LEEVLCLDNLDQLKALADQHRVAILRQLMQGPATITHLGKRFEEEPAKARYHVKELERAGLVRLVEKREKAGTLEKYYEAVARRFVLNVTVLAGGSEDGFNAMTSGILRDLTAALGMETPQLGSTGLPGGWPVDSASAIARISPTRAEQFAIELQALVDRFSDEPNDPRAVPYGLAYLLYRAPQEQTNTIVAIGSNDLTLDLLARKTEASYPGLKVSTLNVGSLGGLVALHRGAAHIAGCHLIDPDTGEYNIPYVRRMLPGQEVVVVNLAYRQQGLITAAGNPKHITGLNDLLRSDVTFVNRERGSGTRVLLDLRFKEQGLDPTKTVGYEREEYTHLAVAVAVKDGKADAGLGIMAAAQTYGLDFFPLAQERYDLVIPKAYYESELLRPLLTTLRSDTFKAEVQAMGGYDTTETGQVIAKL